MTIEQRKAAFLALLGAHVPEWPSLNLPQILDKLARNAEIAGLLTVGDNHVKPRTVQSWRQIERAPGKNNAGLLVVLSNGTLDANKIIGPYLETTAQQVKQKCTL